MENHVQLDEALGLISCLTMEKKRSGKVLREDFPPQHEGSNRMERNGSRKACWLLSKPGKGGGPMEQKRRGDKETQLGARLDLTSQWFGCGVVNTHHSPSLASEPRLFPSPSSCCQILWRMGSACHLRFLPTHFLAGHMVPTQCWQCG